jgi:hypothetical protein
MGPTYQYKIIVIPAVLYRFKTRSPTLMEEHRLKVIDFRLL